MPRTPRDRPRGHALEMTMTAPSLLNADGTASMATMFMMAHHGLRRDAGRLVRALRALDAGGTETAASLREGFESFQKVLHGHHQAEDTGMFPGMRAQNPELGAAIDALGADHRQIDPLLEKLSTLFAA